MHALLGGSISIHGSAASLGSLIHVLLHKINRLQLHDEVVQR